MSFTKKKRDKIKRISQKRVLKECGHMIGCYIDHDFNLEIVDQAKINKTIYLLVADWSNRHSQALVPNCYSIYKIVKVENYVLLSPSRVLDKFANFSNPDFWELHSKIRISSDGRYITVRPNRKS